MMSLKLQLKKLSRFLSRIRRSTNHRLVDFVEQLENRSREKLIVQSTKSVFQESVAKRN
nr:MAG TPA: hypothetical protein [Caudoviricetes sp.]